MVRTPLGILAKPASLADVFATQEPVTFLHKRTKRSVALGHDVVRRIERISSADSYLAPLHQAFNSFRCCPHAF
jgi:hypothetical protein